MSDLHQIAALHGKRYKRSRNATEERSYVLLVFAGIWALMASTNDIVRAFVMLRTHQEL